jgi:DNA-binding cell septation regulator SpoVG
MSVNGIEITDVIIFPVKNSDGIGNLKAFARVFFNDNFIINGIRIIKGTNGPFIGFPQETSKIDGKCYDICFPITTELRAYIVDQVLNQYTLTINAQG